MQAGQDRILLLPEVAAETRVPIDTLRHWRKQGKGPKSWRLGRRVAYFQSDVIAWISEQGAQSVVGGAG
jgi:predicted DNA-binding transcriptional regulator AlpA